MFFHRQFYLFWFDKTDKEIFFIEKAGAISSLKIVCKSSVFKLASPYPSVKEVPRESNLTGIDGKFYMDFLEKWDRYLLTKKFMGGREKDLTKKENCIKMNIVHVEVVL